MIYELDVTIVAKSGREYVAHDTISTNAVAGKSDVVSRFVNVLMGNGSFSIQEGDEAYIIRVDEIESIRLVFHEQEAGPQGS